MLPRHGQLADAAHRVARGDEREIRLAEAQDLEAAAGGVGRNEPQVHRRVLAPEAHHRVPEEVAHGGATGGDGEAAGLAVTQRPDALQGDFDRVESFERQIAQDAPGRGRFDPASLALEQRHPELGLEPGDVLAHRRLGAAELARERAQAAGLAGGDEHAQVF